MDLQIIGVDHGWSSIKTSDGDVFISGVKKIPTEPPVYTDVLEYKGAYYQIGGERLPVRDTKTETPDYYILTLAAIGSALRKRHIRECSVFLAAGLPLTRFGDEKKDFLSYLKQEEDISFKYENEPYKVHLYDAAVFPQCYSGVIDRLAGMGGRVVVVDIGSWTVDIMPVSRKKPVMGECITSAYGLIRCMRSVNDRISREYNVELHEDVIGQLMRYKTAKGIDEDLKNAASEEIRAYAEKILNTLREYGHDTKTNRIVFVGGGAAVMRNFGNLADKSNISYVLDICANAKGFETLARCSLKAAGE